jgi:hypothetical protein
MERGLGGWGGRGGVPSLNKIWPTSRRCVWRPLLCRHFTDLRELPANTSIYPARSFALPLRPTQPPLDKYPRNIELKSAMERTLVEALDYKQEGREFPSPDWVIRIFRWFYHSDRTRTLGWTQSLTEISARSLPSGEGKGKGCRCLGMTTVPPSCTD